MIAVVDPSGGASAGDLLPALTRGPSAVVLLADVPAVLGLDQAEAATAVAGWVNAGAVELWADFHAGPALVVAQHAASALGLELAPDFGGDGLRWALAEKWVEKARPEFPGMIRESDLTAKAARRGEPHPGLDGYADGKAADPCRDAGRDQHGPAVREMVGHGKAPASLHLLGVRQAWPVAPTEAGACGACRGEPLGVLTFCLWCCRSGAEHLLPPVSAATATRAWNRDNGIAGGTGKAKGGKVKAGKVKVKAAAKRRKAG